VLVKRFDGPPLEVRYRMRRSLAFETAFSRAQARWLDAPRCLGWDEDAGLLAFELIPDARSGADLAASAEFGDDLARRAGLAIGSLHGLPPAAVALGRDVAGSTPPLPSAELLDGLPVAVFASSSAAELQAWHLMQHDRPLIRAVRELLRQQSLAALRPAHCDLRLEQLLIDADMLYLCDWEEFRLADPARDIGSFAGEWLHRAVQAIAGAGADSVVGDVVSHADIVSRIAGGIDRLRPLTAAFWSGYRQVRPDAEAGLATRAAAFAGWHLFDRMLAAARRSPRLSAVDRAAAGIGRTILLAPADFAGTLGLGDQP
jgi:hypothetical protein